MSKPGSSRRWIVIVLLFLAAGGGWYYWVRHNNKAPEYYTTAVTRGDVVQTVTATGTLQPVLDVLVSSQISGYINSLEADFNSKVKKGDLLCTLLPTNYRAALKSAEGDLANAKANYDLQKVNVDRDKQLLDKKLIAQSDYDTAAALLEEAAAQVQIKTASVETARANLSYTEIRSPIDGIVIKRAVDIGNSVSASLNSPTLFEIANDLTKMQIDAAVSEADIGNVADGQDVTFTVDAYLNRQFHGKVFQIRNAPQTQQNVVIYDVMISVDNSDLKLKPGMTANTSIIIARRTDTLRLANSTLRVRLPESLLPPKPAETKAAAGAPAAAAKPASEDARRQQLRQLMADAGYERGNGPPSPEIRARIEQLAKERGIELPERFGGGGGGKANATVVRTIYRLPAGSPHGPIEAVQVKLGITDGVYTEVIDGLKEGDAIVTGVNLPSEGGAPAGGNPFTPGRRF